MIFRGNRGDTERYRSETGSRTDKNKEKRKDTPHIKVVLRYRDYVNKWVTKIKLNVTVSQI